MRMARRLIGVLEIDLSSLCKRIVDQDPNLSYTKTHAGI